MEKKQADALRLADAIQTGVEYRKTGGVHVMEINAKDAAQAAAELRRLSRVETELLAMIFSEAGCTFDAIYTARLVRAEAQRDELMKVCRMAMMLKHLGGMLPGSREIVDSIVNAASAAIAKVEGRTCA